MDFISSPCPGHTTGPAGQLFTLLMQSVMAAPCNLSNPDIWPEDKGDQIDQGEKTYLRQKLFHNNF